MLGMIGLVISKKSQIINTVQIYETVKEGESYLCRFLNDPNFTKVCDVKEIQEWTLFMDREEADHWIEKSQKPPAKLESVPDTGKDDTDELGERSPEDNQDPPEPDDDLPGVA